MAKRFFIVFLILVVQIWIIDASMDDSELNPSRVKVGTGIDPEGVVVELARVANPPSSNTAPAPSPDGVMEESGVAEAPELTNRRLGKHHSSDKSVAGGGVIIGGLVTAIFAAVFLYIRATRKKDGGHH